MTTSSFVSSTRLPRSTLTRDLPNFFLEEYDALFQNPPPPEIVTCMRESIELRPAVLSRQDKKELLRMLMGIRWVARLVFDEYEHDTRMQSLLEQATVKKMQDETMDLATLAFIYGDHMFDVLSSLERRGLIVGKTNPLSHTKARVTAR